MLVIPILAACESRPLSCGEYPADGGPAAIVTRDQQVCEAVRLRVMQHLSGMKSLDLQSAEKLYESILTWRRASTLEDLYARAEKTGGPEMAAAVRRAVESVREETAKPVSEKCAKKLEACLTKGAAKGAELAMGQRSYLVQGRTPSSDAVPAGARRNAIDIEDMAD